MEENKELSGQQPENSTPEENRGQGEKLFTQADVDRIIGERLKRVRMEKQDTAELEAREKAVAARESALKCREYLADHGYPAELLDVINTSDADEFGRRADKAYSVISDMQARISPVCQAAPLANTESLNWGYNNDGIQSAFSPGRKHTPRDYLPYYEE